VAGDDDGMRRFGSVFFVRGEGKENVGCNGYIYDAI
jgi:hypothetical protein